MRRWRRRRPAGRRLRWLPCSLVSPVDGRGRGPPFGRHHAYINLNVDRTERNHDRASVLDRSLGIRAMPHPLTGPVVAFASRLRFPTLFKVTLGLMVMSWLLPDVV